MPKTPLKVSPLSLISQEFLEISLKATTDTEHAQGNLEVLREEMPVDGNPRRWRVVLQVNLNTTEGVPPPPYTGHVVIRGVYEVSEKYEHDPARLIRVTGASMLYGAVREVLAGFTARSANGMVTLPSVSFYEKPPEPPAKKTVGRKKTVK